MKKVLFTLAFALVCVVNVSAQTKKDGTPDMRYKANKETYGNSYSTSSYSTSTSSSSNYSTPIYSAPKTTERNYDNGGQYKIQQGYQKSNGTYVAPHLKTTPDNKTYNNYNPKN